jgi:hypothetical protein
MRGDDRAAVPEEQRPEALSQPSLVPASAPRPVQPAAIVAVVTATIAFAAYATTLLPGVDLGDTGGFQAAVLWPETSARQGYPLYYALARPFVLALSAAQPARGLNLFSAVGAAAAVGLLAYVAGIVMRSALAGAAAGLLLAFSYTFWSQAIIAEVYALHLALVALCLIALQAYARRPTTGRLALFFAVYAASFGNHLSMIVLLVPFAVFLLCVHHTPRVLLRGRTVALAIAIALAGACLYLPNFLFIWTNIDAPARWTERLAAFWFDTTKADWRETMVFGIAGAQLSERAAMWLWDARQQFGVIGIALAVIGVVRLWRSTRPWALLVVIAYAMSTAFALTYNVGDPHVFFLPSHLFTAFAAAAALAPGTSGTHRATISHVLAVLVIAYAAWRGWETWPRVDRHGDRRGDALVARMTAGIDEDRAVLLSGLDWQTENALLYAARHERRNLAWVRLADVMPHLPFFVRDNHRIGRDVVVTSGAAEQIVAAYGPYFPLFQDPLPAALADVAGALPTGTPFVLCLLSPNDESFDPDDFQQALGSLTGGRGEPQAVARYQVWAGVTGAAPAFSHRSDRPFREEISLLGDRMTIQMDGWLPFDTFRRGGFGRVLRGREPVLTVERGVSLVWFPADGAPRVVYAGGLYAPSPRFRIPAAVPQQAAGTPNAIVRTAAPAG